eukprot:572005-Pelagomonas_calceolata.AAC.1
MSLSNLRAQAIVASTLSDAALGQKLLEAVSFMHCLACSSGQLHAVFGMLFRSCAVWHVQALLYLLDLRFKERLANQIAHAHIHTHRLFILNGNLKCDKVEGQEGGGSADAPCMAPAGSLEALRAAARSFDVLPA